MNLLEHARSGDLAGLRERLEDIVRKFNHRPGAEMTEDDKLIDEALTYARLGDLSEATHRLRLRSQPKFHDVTECSEKYKQAMLEKRQRGAAAA